MARGGGQSGPQTPRRERQLPQSSQAVPTEMVILQVTAICRKFLLDMNYFKKIFVLKSFYLHVDWSLEKKLHCVTCVFVFTAQW